jgi:uncharacterized protein
VEPANDGPYVSQVAELPHPERLYQLRDLDTGTVAFGRRQIPVWVMDTDSKRAEGMMFLKDDDVPEGHGMLFLFEEPQQPPRAFWMRNTHIPLDIIYISADRRVVNVGQGEPLNEDPVPADGAYQYVLELKQGTAARYRIRPGSRLEFKLD